MQGLGDQLHAEDIVAKLTHCLDGKVAYIGIVFDPPMILFLRVPMTGAGKKFPPGCLENNDGFTLLRVAAGIAGTV
jgi:hypothetical protein